MAKMSSSRSRFYVDTPLGHDPPSQRHSMYVSQSEVNSNIQKQDNSSASSSATLPSAAGSVDRLTGLGNEKKTPRFFTLKPKTSFSLRPFFSSNSISSLSPSKRRKASEIAPKRDSYVQTDGDDRAYDEVGVQTQNASTVDVPVQTCSNEWDEGDTYRKSFAIKPTFPRGPYGGYSSRWSPSALSKPPVLSSDDSKGTKNSIVTPLDSSRLLKYASPPESADSSTKPTSARILGEVKSSDSSPLIECLQSSKGVSAKPFSITELPSSTECSKSVSCGDSDNKNVILISSSQPGDLFKQRLASKEIPSIESVKPHDLDVFAISAAAKNDASRISKSNSDSKVNLIRSSDSPTSVLKIERTDSPKSSKTKTVHFQLSDSEVNIPASKSDPESSKPRNIDKDFEALLRDLDILTDEPYGAKVNISPTTVPEQSPRASYISPDLKSALEGLKQDFLAPIPENDSNSDENQERISHDYSTKPDEIVERIKEDLEPKNFKITQISNEDPKSLSNTYDEDENKLSGIKNEGCESTSFAIFTSAKLDPDREIDDKSANVYDKENTENSVNPVSLPTLPSFFESSSECKVSYPKENISSDLELPIAISTNLPLESTEDTMLSRSSSRSSMRSNPRSDFEACLERTSTFDSCENLDQLEEEIIRSLYSADDGDWEENTEPFILPGAKLMDPCSNGPTHMRRNILDRLLSGEKVDEIMPMSAKTMYSEEVISDPVNTRKKIKPGKKYTATLLKYEEPYTENISSSPLVFQQNNMYSSKIASDQNGELHKYSPIGTLPDQMDNSIVLHRVEDRGKYPKTSVFLFPETNPQPTAVISKYVQSKPVSEVTFSANEGLNTFSNVSSNIQDISKKEENLKDHSLTRSDFSNCVLPSEIHNSQFFTEIRSKPFGGSCQSPVTSSAQVVISSNEKSDKAEVAKPVGQCDFGNCLKPSQVQNSIFTAELSEITAGKSSNLTPSSFRTNSPLAMRTNSPRMRTNSPLNMRTNTPPYNKSESQEQNALIINERGPSSAKTEDSENPVQHRSEATIILQSSNRSPIECKQGEQNENEYQVLSVDSENNQLATNDHESEGTSSEQNVVDTPIISETYVPPPPPPPPPPTKVAKDNIAPWRKPNISSSLESEIQDRHSKLSPTNTLPAEQKSLPKTPVMLELEKRFEMRSQFNPEKEDNSVTQFSKTDTDFESSDMDTSTEKRSENNIGRYENCISPNGNVYKAERNGFSPEPRMKSPLLVNCQNGDYHNRSFSPNTVITHEPPPPGAVLVDRKVTVDGDKVHTDKYYALPIKEVLKETTSTTKFIPAPPKYEGIGPTEDGIPIGLRNSVKKENMHNWYKTMFKSLHKADSSNDPQEYIIGYSSEPESSKKDKMVKKKSATLDNRSNNNTSNINKNHFGPGFPPNAKSSIETYNVRPRLIEDYEPGQSSVTDEEITIGSKRFLPPMNVPKSSYEFKNGYEQDNHYTKHFQQPEPPSSEQQKTWYKEIQLGGEIPQYGLGKPAPEKLREPTIGPLPPPPLNYNGPTISHQATRPLTLPTDYALLNENGSSCQQLNGAYEIQMRQAIHTELHQRLSPSSSQLSSPTRSILKSPSKSPDLKIPARALFDFRAESPKEIPLKKGDNVLILRQLDKNWYEGEKQGITGIFPISYIEIVPPEHVSTPQSSLEGVGKVIFDFTAHTPAELSVKKLDTVSLLRKVDSNWYEAQFKNKKGIIPSSYLQVLQEPTGRRTPLSSPNSYISSPGRSNSREGILKPVTTSPSSYSTSISSPTITNGRSKLQSRSKKSSNLVEPVMYRAMYSYSPQNSDELDLAEGDTVYVVEMCDDGWFVGTSVRNGVFGIFPGNYVEKV